MASSQESCPKDLTPQDFLPIRILGHGDIGTVFLVQLCRNNKSYAMKVMQKEVLRHKGEKRATTERKVLSMLSHPFLPSLHAHFQSEKHVFFIMDFCSGGDLNVLQQKQPMKRFSESITRFYAAEVVVALEYLHQKGIIYRDLKPENILIQGNGHIMLTDFDLSLVLPDKKPEAMPHPELKRKHKKTLGAFFSCFNPYFGEMTGASEANSCDEHPCASGETESCASLPQEKGAQKFNFPFHMWPRKALRKAKQGRHASVCRSHSFVGTEEYVAPEVLWGKGHGFSVDWWTLGIFLYEMVYGKTPFKGLNRKETFYNILCREPEFPSQSFPLIDLIKKLLVKEAEARLGSFRGAEEIKKHPYFKGTAWKHLSEVARPPFVPPPVHVHIDRRTQRSAEKCGKDEPSIAGNPLSSSCQANAAAAIDKSVVLQAMDCEEKENLQEVTNFLPCYMKTSIEKVGSPKPLRAANDTDMKGRAVDGAEYASIKKCGKPM
ncbi:hypothetical protein GOP47_0017911 [Adiantum capillus-veneris]|uniref:non-specific serine/threonine protein kinase n=1 Tax=Adiantum capillus-veneris TaxID=13818 RepID=A0A9D4UH63_ADICA|nr:hypothetical protein GOP47_0017911 [Adiantum capillus-veneris]